jgi:hypothetical protein
MEAKLTAKKAPDAAAEISTAARNEGFCAVPARHMPDARECALLLLRLIESKETESGKALSRFRVAEISLRRIWGRQRVTPEFVGDVNEWLLRAGRTLFFAGNSYGVILTSAVESWSRLSSKRIAPEIQQALSGAYDFAALEPLLSTKEEGFEEDSME